MSAFSKAAVVDTPEGLMLVDTISVVHAKTGVRRRAALLAAPRAHRHLQARSRRSLGLAAFEVAGSKGWAARQVIAHHACPVPFNRYRLANGSQSGTGRR